MEGAGRWRRGILALPTQGRCLLLLPLKAKKTRRGGSSLAAVLTDGRKGREQDPQDSLRRRSSQRSSRVDINELRGFPDLPGPEVAPRLVPATLRIVAK